MMLRARNHRNDVERGREGADIAGPEGVTRPGVSAQPQHSENPEIGMNNQNEQSRSPEESHEQQCQDFDDDANDLWSLYGKEAKSYDEVRIKTLKEDMDGILIFAGLFSAVLTAFVVPQIQTLQVNPVKQSVYYQDQSVQMLDRISQQLASVGGQILTNFTPPSPYPTFRALASDRRVNILWIISLICSLSAALLATLVQQWYRGYMRVFQHSRKPLKAARVRLFLFEGIERLPIEAVPGLIHLSLMLFFWGLCDFILQIDGAVFVATAVPIGVCGCLYLYCIIEQIWNPQSPYRSPFSGFISYLIREQHRNPNDNQSREKEVKPESMEERQIDFAMKATPDREKRDVRAIRWLVDNINGTNDTENLLLSIPGSFSQGCGRKVWQGVVSDDLQTQPAVGLPSPREGTTVHNLCKSVRYFFETYSIEGGLKDTKERLKRMRGCVETAASLVCCTEVELGLFGEVGEVLGELGDKERTNDPLTIKSNSLFTMRWTCLSLVAIWKMLDSDRDHKVQAVAKMALDGIARFQAGFGHAVPLTGAQKIDRYLKRAWAPVLDLRQAFEPLDQVRTIPEIREILINREASIKELEDIEIETIDMEAVDWRISVLQNAIDDATHRLTRRLPGIFFNELKPAAPTMIREAFDVSSTVTAPAPPQLIFPGRRIQSLCTLGRRLRDIINGKNLETHDECVKSLKSLSEIPITLRRLDHPIKRQLWRLMDLHDGGGLGFTVELFFLALRQLSSASLSDGLKENFYRGTFKTITSNWEKSKNSAGTQRILLDILCDLVTRSRGVFSDTPYPPYIMEMLLKLVEDMVKGHGGKHPHINDVITELKNETLWNRMDSSLRKKALIAIVPPSHTDLRGVEGAALLGTGAGVG